MNTLLSIKKNCFSLLANLFLILFSANALAQAVDINPSTSYQTMRGFGGFNGAGWIDDLTSAQVDSAFGTGSGQIGLSIMRMRIDPSNSNWQRQVPTAQLAKAKGVTLFATPWSPPASMKTNNNLVSGRLSPAYYPDYATHLLNFAAYMEGSSAALYGISVQNEPDWDPTYEGCQWNSTEFINFLKAQGSRFGSLKVMTPESLNFSKTLADPILNDANAAAQFDIVAGHLYGVSPSDYPLARSKGKELWMTEHFTDNSDANDWAKAMPAALELHNSMVANYSAYVWWYIRRSYGLITEDGNVSKRGYIMSQYAKYVRPGYTRIAATEKPYADVFVTAYKNSSEKIVVVAINNGTSQRQVKLQLSAASSGSATAFVKYRTSSSFNNEYAGQYTVTSGLATAYIDPGSVNTFVSQ
ncbi:glycoside hydrolase family 30 beta sandwich domain-containing protein [Undibacterium sp. Ji49W]|uniref:glycoside hydrolase family 30 beta sandwich domain-containing protein n=1 Tax=Undibacterium sp. Ji49W TaxID=3413040 RepID=UPI003BF203E7